MRKWTIGIFYNAPAVIQELVFGIALYSDQNLYQYGTNTERKNITIDKIEGDGYVNLKMETMPMRSGRFLLTVAVHSSEGNAYDWIDKQYSFEVLLKGRDSGILEVPCKWVT
ncbi:MAG: lipopolysaccharide transport system ATP-binding protein [Euryarchaeota archaeon]|nr:lipopolysaccharide transport system ATP-binding protein [Euryarchaeota archaeon]